MSSVKWITVNYKAAGWWQSFSRGHHTANRITHLRCVYVSEVCTSSITAGNGNELVWCCEAGLQHDALCAPTVKPHASTTHRYLQHACAHTLTHTNTHTYRFSLWQSCRSTMAVVEFFISLYEYKTKFMRRYVLTRRSEMFRFLSFVCVQKVLGLLGMCTAVSMVTRCWFGLWELLRLSNFRTGWEKKNLDFRWWCRRESQTG